MTFNVQAKMIQLKTCFKQEKCVCECFNIMKSLKNTKKYFDINRQKI